METNEIRNYDDEMTIDLGHLVVSVFKKWRSLVLLVLVGALLGAAMSFLPKNEEELSRSREDAALIEQMNVASAARAQYDELRRYVTYSPFMRLDSQKVFTANAEYYIPKCEDPDQIIATFNALLADETVRDTLCKILGIYNDIDLNKMFWHSGYVQTDPKIVGDMQVELKEKVSLHLGVYAATREQAREALDFLEETLEKLPGAVTPKQYFDLVKISDNIQSGIASALRDGQNAVREELSAAHKNYTTLEQAFSEEEFAMYEEYILTDKADELPLELFPSNPLKMPVILAFVFGFLGCGWYAVAYLMGSKVKTVDEVVSITAHNVLGFVNEKAPAKNAIDRWLEGLESGSFPAPVSPAYAAAATGKLGKAVVVCDETNEDLKKLAQAMNVSAMGLLSQNPQTLNTLNADTKVVLLVKLGVTTKMQLQRETALCRQYNIPLAGSVLVK